MKIRHVLALGLLGLLGFLCLGGFGFAPPQSLQRQNEVLFGQLQSIDGLSGDQIDAIRKIFANSGYIGQGNPAVNDYPVTPEACQAKVKSMGVQYENPRFEKICKAKYMAPLYNRSKQKPEDAKACIDQFEFPDIPCTYPVGWVKAREAAEICSAMGKRLCDAHEWEGACAGDLCQCRGKAGDETHDLKFQNAQITYFPKRFVFGMSRRSGRGDPQRNDHSMRA